MNRWTLVALVVGVGLGYLLAEARRAPERARAEHAAVPATRESAAPVRRTGAPSVPAEPVAVRPAIVEPRPDEPVEAGEGMGVLRVDFAGLPDAFPLIETHGTDVTGDERTMEKGAKAGTTVEVEWPADTIRVTWTDGGAMHRCEARVRIEAGRATEIDAADPRYRLPEPPGLAVLTVRVAAAGGGWRAGADVLLDCEDFVLPETTNRDGFARWRVKPGTYALELGTLRQTVELGAGERRTIELSHGRRGDVVIEPSCPGNYSLWRDPNDLSGFSCLFVDEGVYELRYQYEDWSRRVDLRPSQAALGTVRVLAGQTTVFRHEGQPGAIDVLADVSKVPGAGGVAWSVRIGRALPVPLRAGEAGLAARVEGLDPGTYPVVILADGRTRHETTALIGFDSTTRVRVAIEPR